MIDSQLIVRTYLQLCTRSTSSCWNMRLIPSRKDDDSNDVEKNCWRKWSARILTTMQSANKMINELPRKHWLKNRWSTINNLLRNNYRPALSSPKFAKSPCDIISNLSLDQDKFPSQFQQVQVTLLLKKAGRDVDDSASYRPISNLNTIWKIIKRLLAENITT